MTETVTYKGLEDTSVPVMEDIHTRWGRWIYPIGPAPKNWHRTVGCSRTIPHDENSEQWQNDEMNSEHTW